MTRYLVLLFPFALLSMGVHSQQGPPRISVPDINGRATNLVKPVFPDTAVATGADGATVTVLIVVDESGNVTAAKCSASCHPMLRDAAEVAAAASTFRPLLKDGRLVPYDGVLLYTFVVERVRWFNFGSALESARQFDNITLGPAANMLSAAFGGEKAKLRSLDANGGVDFDTRQKGISEVEASIRSKLKDKDLWDFEMAMGLRRITFWTMAAERTDREQLQQAINALPKYIATAPAGTPENIIRDLTALSKYQVPKDLSEIDLRKAIREMTKGIRID